MESNIMNSRGSHNKELVNKINKIVGFLGQFETLDLILNKYCDDDDLRGIIDQYEEVYESECIEFHSSHGILRVNPKGYILSSSDIDDWLLDIVRVDLEELKYYYSLYNEVISDEGDVLDFGYWDNKDKYHKPDRSWRYDIFNFNRYSNSEVDVKIRKAEEWVKKNR